MSPAISTTGSPHPDYNKLQNKFPDVKKNFED
jgi:hypothetical protein